MKVKVCPNLPPKTAKRSKVKTILVRILAFLKNIPLI